MAWPAAQLVRVLLAEQFLEGIAAGRDAVGLRVAVGVRVVTGRMIDGSTGAFVGREIKLDAWQVHRRAALSGHDRRGVLRPPFRRSSDHRHRTAAARPGSSMPVAS